MTERDPELNILAPIGTRPRLDRLERLVRRSGGGRMSRAEALGLGGLALLAAAGCGGKTSTGGGGGGAASSGATDSLAGKPMESNLVIYNWSQHDDPSTYKSSKTQNHVAIKETYYSSNDELLAKLHAGGTGCDIILPSQNATGELVQLGSLMTGQGADPERASRGVVLGEDVVRPHRRLLGGQGLRRHHRDRARSGGGARVDQPPLRPGGGRQGDGVPQLPDPDPGGGRPEAGAEPKNDPLFHMPTSYTDGYKFILNPSQEIVNARTQIYTAFQSA